MTQLYKAVPTREGIAYEPVQSSETIDTEKLKGILQGLFALAVIPRSFGKADERMECAKEVQEAIREL